MPSNTFIDIVHRSEDIFREFHGHSLILKKNPIDRLSRLLAREIPEAPLDIFQTDTA